MMDVKRRDFLRQSSVLIASGALTACGGGVTDASTAGTPTPDAGTSAPPSAAGTSAPPSAAGTSAPPPAAGASGPPPAAGTSAPPPAAGTSAPPPAAGTSAPPPTGAIPAWLAGKAIGEWVEIPGTSGADGSVIDAWCGFCVVPSTGELLIPLAGGHNDGWGTRISSITLLDDTPTWKSPRRKESITADLANPGQPYCKDGVTPSSRHTRYQTLYCPQNNRIMLMGSPSIYGPGTASIESNGFDLATNTWDAPGTWPSLANNSNQGTAIDDLGNIWCRGQKWIRATNTLVTMPGPSTTFRITVFDPVRRQLFALSNGDGQGYSLNLGFVAKTISEDLSTVHNITFNASSAWTEFSSLTHDYSAMTYDPDRDLFYYYYGKGIAQGVVYVITPNAGTAWDMSKLAQGSGSLLPPAVPPAGINARFQYVTALKGIVLLPRQSSNLYFMRTT